MVTDLPGEYKKFMYYLEHNFGFEFSKEEYHSYIRYLIDELYAVWQELRTMEQEYIYFEDVQESEYKLEPNSFIKMPKWLYKGRKYIDDIEFLPLLKAFNNFYEGRLEIE